MALDTFSASSVPLVFDTHQIATRAVGIFEPGVAPETKPSGRVESQILLIIRVVYGWAMTVFTFDRRVHRSIQLRYVFFMAFNTKLSAAMFHGKVFPFLNIAQSMIAIREVPSVNSEVIGNQKLPGYEDQTDQTDCNP